MIIGLCDEGFAAVREAIATALPEAELRTVTGGGAGEADVLVPLGGTIDGELMDRAAPRLIQQFGVGLQGVDLDAARQRDIPVANVPAEGTGNATAVAEIALLHLLALSRRYAEARAAVTERRVGEPTGNTLAGRTVTVLGVGAIGRELIPRLAALAVTPLGVGRRDYSEHEELAALLPARQYYRTGALNAALERSDTVIACTPLTEQTRGILGRAQLAALRPGGYLINVGRGGLVDHPALLEALRSGRLAGAGLDVAWSEPIDPGDELLRENVTVTPHIGGVTVESYAGIAGEFAANVRRMAEGRAPEHLA